MQNQTDKKKWWHNITENETLKAEFSDILFNTESVKGKMFEIMLLSSIFLSVVIVLLDSIKGFHDYFYSSLVVLEWIFTVFFTIEYLMRLYCHQDRKKYVFGFYGIIDLLATLPTYLSLIDHSAHYLMVIRIFRIIRVFRLFKMFSFMTEMQILLNALKDSMKKLVVFFSIVVLAVISLGALMYMIEFGEPESNFKNIPISIYWAIVTMTTVGYGDIAPVTIAGKIISVMVMILGYTVIAVPTGVVSSSMIDGYNKRHAKICPFCGTTNARQDSLYCKNCGKQLIDNDEDDEEII